VLRAESRIKDSATDEQQQLMASRENPLSSEPLPRRINDETTNVLQDWAAHVRYPKSLQMNRPIVDTGLFKSVA